MPSDFETLFAAYARPQLIAHHGVSGVTYVDLDGTSTPVTPILGPVAADLLQGEDGRTFYYHRTAEVSAAAVAAPRRGDKLTIDSAHWTVHEILPSDGGLWRVQLVLPKRTDTAGRGRPPR